MRGARAIAARCCDIVQTLTRSGEVRRERQFVAPKTQAYRVRVLEPGDAAVRGSKAQALVAFVREQPGVPRADAVLAGFSTAVIARAIKLGAIVEREVEPATLRDRTPLPLTRRFRRRSEQREALARIDAALDTRSLRRDAALRRDGQRQDLRVCRGDQAGRARRRPRDRARPRDLAHAADRAPLRRELRRSRGGAAFGALGARTLRCVAGLRARRDRRRRRSAQRRLRAACRRAALRGRRGARDLVQTGDVAALSRRHRRARADARRAAAC